MSDLTTTFLNGINSKEFYKSYDVRCAINELDGASCDLDDSGGNWEIILLHDDNRNKHQIAGFLSRYYPVALIKDICPKIIIKTLEKSNIYIELFDEPFSCDEEILKKYAPFTKILDDRFLDDGNFSLDDELLFYIFEDIKYVTTFNEIR